MLSVMCVSPDAVNTCGPLSVSLERGGRARLYILSTDSLKRLLTAAGIWERVELDVSGLRGAHLLVHQPANLNHRYPTCSKGKYVH